jgi:NAD(P)-dependent dehydrogenase (short-subunit alcohol dehydrogenase family)
MKEVVLVTGASSGFGLLTAQALARAGHAVYASMREAPAQYRVAARRRLCRSSTASMRSVESTSATTHRSTPPSIA